MYNKVVDSTKTSVHKAILLEFGQHLPDIVEAATNIYEDLLMGIAINKDSLSNPEYFFDTYIDRITNFNYIKSTTEIVLEIPNEETFDFSGELVILKMITEGVVGNYLELPERDLNVILKAKGLDDKVKRRFRSLPGISEADIPLSRRFSLLNSKSDLANIAQEILDKKLIHFPFSNMPPVDLFINLEAFVQENINSWISEGINKGLTQLKEERIYV
jgi:hypothetical protein